MTSGAAEQWLLRCKWSVPNLLYASDAMHCAGVCAGTTWSTMVYRLSVVSALHAGANLRKLASGLKTQPRLAVQAISPCDLKGVNLHLVWLASAASFTRPFSCCWNSYCCRSGFAKSSPLVMSSNNSYQAQSAVLQRSKSW